MTEPAPPQILVILPFTDPAKAETFCQLIAAQTPEAIPPLMLHGRVFEYKSEDEGNAEVIEILPASNFEAYVGPEGDGHHILQRKLITVHE